MNTFIRTNKYSFCLLSKEEIALATNEDFPHLRGDMMTVLVSDWKLNINFDVSSVLSVKSSDSTILPYEKGIFMAYFFCKCNKFI